MRPRERAGLPSSVAARDRPLGTPPGPGERSAHVDLSAEDALDLILTTAEQGILVHDATAILIANRRAAELLDYPERLMRPGADFKAFITFGERRGDFRGIDNFCFDDMLEWIRERDVVEAERKLPNGRVVRVDSRRKGRFRITTYTDITAARLREDQLRRSRAKIRQLAVNDGLTGILNRSTFDTRVADVLAAHYRANFAASGPRPALIALDLDGFKAVNDTRGHLIGDGVLRIMAERFVETLGADDMVARLGGDEFAVLTVQSEEREVHRLALRMCAVARQPVRIEDFTVTVGASAGYLLAPEGATSPSDMLRFADLALYHVKRSGGGDAAAYRPRMLADSRNRAELEADLRHAVANDELVLHYQVQHDMHAQTVVGYEALMRWNHPRRGLLSPGEFIPIAEDSGIIVELGRWALRRATMDFARVGDRLRVAVNVSPIQVSQCDMVAEVREALRLSGLKPSQLEIEVTEEVLMEDTERTRAVLENLVALGVSLSLDDFGSGYSSLAYLTLFPFKKIKIDRSFVARMSEDERAATLVSSILAMVGALKLKVSAEGVETAEQLSALARHGCDEAQGFFLGRPEPLDELRARGMTRSAIKVGQVPSVAHPVALPVAAGTQRAAGYMDTAGLAEETLPAPITRAAP